MPQRNRWAALLVSMLLVVAACGSAGDADDEATVAGAAEAAAATGARTGRQTFGSTGPDGYGVTECPPATGTAEPVRTFLAPFKRCIDLTKTYVATISTNLGVLTVNLDPRTAPIGVNNFVALARNRFYDGLTCHRIVPSFVAQCGDPSGDGRGGPGYRIVDELPKPGAYNIGSIAMANAGPDTSGSQFFVITGVDGVLLPPQYTLIGLAVGSEATIRALDGAANAERGANGMPPRQPVVITSVVITES